MADDNKVVPAHEQKVTHRYQLRYPEHGPRESDPAYADFHAYKANRKDAGTWYCDFAHEYRDGDSSECDLTKPLEAHHEILEWAILQSVDMALLEEHFPGVSKMGVGKWTESDQNLTLLCCKCHRGPGGVHNASASDYEGEKFVRNLISKAPQIDAE